MRADTLYKTNIAMGTMGAKSTDATRGKLRGDQEAVPSMMNQSCPRSGVGKWYLPFSNPLTISLATCWTVYNWFELAQDQIDWKQLIAPITSWAC